MFDVGPACHDDIGMEPKQFIVYDFSHWYLHPHPVQANPSGVYLGEDLGEV